MTTNDGEFMRPTDAFSWYQEADPALRATIVGIAWLDKSPSWPDLVTRVEAAARFIPRFRQRVEELPARLAPPRWVQDERFDLSWHLRRIAAPAPHTPDTVLDLARIEAMTAFDRSRPLWTFTLVEGITGHRAALIMKVHHALTDGQGAIKLAPYLFDRQRVSPMPPRKAPGTAGTRRNLLLAGLAHNWNRAFGTISRGVLGTVPAGLRTVRDPVGSAKALLSTIQSIGATVAPVREVLSPVMRGRGLGRGLELVAVELDDLKRAAHAADATVNDAFLAGVTGGMRHYHAAHGATADRLRVTMPVSIRTESDSWASNRITLMRFVLPAGESDPATRMREIDRLARKVSHARSLSFTDAIAGGLDLLPTVVAGSMLKRVDFLASDVIGLPTTVYLAGAKMTAYVAFGPTMGCAANLTMMSYSGTCYVGINLDASAIPDPSVFIACLRAGFDEVLALATPHSGVRVPLRDNEYPGSHRTASTRHSLASGHAPASHTHPRKAAKPRTRPLPPEA